MPLDDELKAKTPSLIESTKTGAHLGLDGAIAKANIQFRTEQGQFQRNYRRGIF
jgi:hypothetical protein